MSAAKGPEHRRLYRIWRGMHDRCKNPKTDSYPRYGGRGISVHDAWGDLEDFKAWALAHGYAANLTIDRIDNDGDYEPDNCRWATLTQQSQNRSVVHRRADGTAWCEVARRNGITVRIFANRIARGLTAEQAATLEPLFKPLSAPVAQQLGRGLRDVQEAAREIAKTDPQAAETLSKIVRKLEGWFRVRNPSLGDDGLIYLKAEDA
jgi:hypothetical protein